MTRLCRNAKKKQSKVQSKKEKKEEKNQKKNLHGLVLFSRKKKAGLYWIATKEKKRIEQNIGLVPQKSQE